MLAGRGDALALTALAAAVGTATPWAVDSVPEWSAALLGAAGAGSLAWSKAYPSVKQASQWLNNADGDSITLPSDKPFVVPRGEKWTHLGITKSHGHSVHIPADFELRHTALIGQSGVGKTTLIEYLLWQQTIRGRGWLFLDAKIDRKTRNHVAYMAEAAGRLDELYILDTSNPDNTNSYNPLLHGDPDEVANRLLNLIPSSEDNPGADHYRQSALHALTVIVAALQASNQLYHFGDLSILLQSERALENLERLTPPGPERRSLTVFLDQYRQKTKSGEIRINVERMRNVLGGMAGRLSTFAQGKFGQVLNVYAPEIVLSEIIRKGYMLYVALPSMAKDTSALNLGKMLVSDFRSAVAEIQDLEEDYRPQPFMAVFDEMGSYVMEGVSRLFEQARSANIALFPAIQSFSQLNKVSRDFADAILQNTWNKVFFKFGSKDSPETAAEIIGKIKAPQYTVTVSAQQGEGVHSLRTTPQASLSDGGGMGESWREIEEFRVSPDQLRQLAMGESVTIIGARVYHVKSPMIKYPSNVPRFEAVRRRCRVPRGKYALRLEERLNEFLLQ